MPARPALAAAFVAVALLINPPPSTRASRRRIVKHARLARAIRLPRRRPVRPHSRLDARSQAGCGGRVERTFTNISCRRRSRVERAVADPVDVAQRDRPAQRLARPDHDAAAAASSRGQRAARRRDAEPLRWPTVKWMMPDRRAHAVEIDNVAGLDGAAATGRSRRRSARSARSRCPGRRACRRLRPKRRARSRVSCLVSSPSGKRRKSSCRRGGEQEVALVAFASPAPIARAILRRLGSMRHSARSPARSAPSSRAVARRSRNLTH